MIYQNSLQKDHRPSSNLSALALLKSLTYFLALYWCAGAPPAAAQFYDAGSGGAEEDEVNEELTDDDDLQSATPSNNVGELDGGNQADGDWLNEGGVEDFPAADNDFEEFNNFGGGESDLFSNEAGANAAGVSPSSAFGNNAAASNAASSMPANQTVTQPATSHSQPPAAAASGSPTPIVTETLTPTLTNPVPSASPASGATPAAPATLNPTNIMPPVTVVDPGKLDPGVAIGATNVDASMLAPPAGEMTPIAAPPLPMPNEFAGAPPVPGTMRLMAEGEAPEEYAVQPGDTLFDICDQLLDEPGYWPKLWALNPEIKNPHFIFPNMRLRFYPGDDETPPYLQVVSEEDMIPIDKGDLAEEVLVAEKVIFPEEAHAEAQAIEVIGPSDVDVFDGEMQTGGGVYSGNEITVQVPGFIFREQKEPLGRIVGGRAGEFNLPPGGVAIIQSEGQVSPGTLYTVLRMGEEVDDPESGDQIGYKYYFVANLRVDKGLEEGVYLGTVQEGNLLGVMPNDILVNYISTFRTLPLASPDGGLSAADAYIVGFQHPGQELGGTGSYAFVGKSGGGSVSPGMYLPIYATPGFLSRQSGDADLPKDYEPVGVIRIIDATDAGAVGYVVRNTQELRVGDRTGKG